MKRELDSLVIQMHSAGISYTDAVRQFKRRYILEVLANNKGNQCKAADELGMHRNTLSRTLAELDMDMVREVRDLWQFFRDRRPETYTPLADPR